MTAPADCHIWPKFWSLLPPELLTDAVLGVARAAVAKGDYSRLPILADALEEAGCDRADVLSHLRRPGPHVAGCWAIHQIVLTSRPYSIDAINKFKQEALQKWLRLVTTSPIPVLHERPDTRPAMVAISFLAATMLMGACRSLF